MFMIGLQVQIHVLIYLDYLSLEQAQASKLKLSTLWETLPSQRLSQLETAVSKNAHLLETTFRYKSELIIIIFYFKKNLLFFHFFGPFSHFPFATDTGLFLFRHIAL